MYIASEKGQWNKWTKKTKNINVAGCFFLLQVSSTWEWNTKLGKVVVISLQARTQQDQNPISHYMLYRFSPCYIYIETHLRYWRVMFLRRVLFLRTRVLHSSLSIFPSCFVSASSNVWTIQDSGKLLSTKIKLCQERKKKKGNKLTLSMMSSMTVSFKFIPDSARVATTICFNCKNVGREDDK